MKRIILILLVLNISIACDDVLDKYPLDEITEEVYWKSATDLQLHINQMYPALATVGDYHRLDNHSDNMQPVTISDVLNGIRSVPATDGGWNWDHIRDVNYFLKNMDKVTVGDKASIDHLKGEGYFFRAYLYFEKVKQFGDVPWYSDVLNIDSEELYATRDPRNVIVTHIIEDLDIALSLLKPKDQIGSNRINRESALLFKSRVCLYEGTWEKYHAGTIFGVQGSNGQEFLQMAEDAAKQLIDEGNLSLYSTNNPGADYWKLFNRLDLTGIDEAVLVMSVDPSQDLGHWNWIYLNGTQGNATGVTKSLVQTYLDINGLPISLSTVYQGDTTLTQVVQNRDPRLKQTIWVPGQIQIMSDPPLVFKYPDALVKGAAGAATTGYMVRKGGTTDPEQNSGTSSDNYGATDAMVFRYAEALLNFAEAKAELGTITQEDLDKSINLIRARVGMPPLSVNVGYSDLKWSFPALSPIINEVRRERRVELALEGHRYDDLMRWAAVDLIQGKRLKGARFILGESFPELEDQLQGIKVDDERYFDRYQTILPNGFGFDESRDYLYPLPTTELTLNKNLTQNPGW